MAIIQSREFGRFQHMTEALAFNLIFSFEVISTLSLKHLKLLVHKWLIGCF